MRIVCENYPLLALLSHAFDVKDYQVSGPDWIANERYNLTATIASGTTKGQALLMWQNLLTERFKLLLHRGTRELPVYALVPDHNGPKLRESTEETIPAAAPKPVAAGGTSRRIKGSKMQMAQLVTSLGFYLDLPLIDQTALTGTYNIDLEWPVEGRITGPGAEGLTSAIQQALQDQLGLKLRSQKSPISVIFIDHAEKTPIEN